MKTCLPFFLTISLLIPAPASSAFYQWTDAKGVVHMTDDAHKVPKQYKGKATRIEVKEPARLPEAAPPEPGPAADLAAPAAGRGEASVPGGHDETWWRAQFGELRSELKTLQAARSQKEQKLVELRRRRAIFQRSRDRAAINEAEAQASADDARIGDLLNRIAALDLAASKAGVPAEWRQ
ncbi:protein of unknown function, DUF4124-containing [Citrifermentans bemidjiense Bem]|uniref:DUF4124 domain-containing protein n=1 Tax=Citrifermentans bemidjiense (strain ATCC BAA-1014 / DSM 16622 / JCM 12645 / Bem) TaxID=404380 RepID=B5EF25_CITBB|nr:DUF4124 domain-containing protein [Citrifermentans bemidjiense]ACH39334.1 protein of unknown function, DUF4124-containing [Citrifermentans bemidjiense Bem]